MAAGFEGAPQMSGAEVGAEAGQKLGQAWGRETGDRLVPRHPIGL
jgi:hypothetical protein